jgi:hypothetical protein
VGFFDLFGSKGKRDESALKKAQQRLVQKYGPPEGRQKTIEQLASQGTPESLAVLCLRFTVATEPTITDAEEKEETRRRLVGAGPKAIAPVKDFIERQEEGVSWGLRVLSELLPPQETVATVLALLHRLGREYQRDPDKKLTLLAWLSEHHGEVAQQASRSEQPALAEGEASTAEEALLPLLEDFSDDVRISALRVASRIVPTERTRTALIELLLRDADNARVRGEVLSALAESGADVKGFRPRVEQLLVEPYYLDREGHVKRRG